MNPLSDYALLIVVSLPILVIVAIQVFLFIAGERGTLLLPSLKPFESIAIEQDEGEGVPAVLATHDLPKTQHQPVRELEREAA